MPRHQQTPWREDAAILARLEQVDPLHLAGWTNIAIARKLGVSHPTIAADIARLNEIYLERIGVQAEAQRARIAAELADVRRRAIAAAEFDNQAERAVLYGETPICPGDGSHAVGSGRCRAEHAVRVVKDDKGSAQFRGQKAQALGVAEKASMDEAKLLGLLVDVTEHKTPLPVRIYELELGSGDSPAG